jgi:hypothetical protein
MFHAAKRVRLPLDPGELQEQVRGLVLLGVGQGGHSGNGLFKQTGHGCTIAELRDDGELVAPRLKH